MKEDDLLKPTNKKFRILIVDDSDFNRAILSDFLGGEYEISEATNGREAVDMLETGAMEFSVILLDVVMPFMDGFGVLTYLNDNDLIDKLPVIMISSETSSSQIDRAYNLGAVDYINRPFDITTVKRRVSNTILLYMKQRHLETMIQEKIEENERIKNMMVSILSHIVEFRNSESGPHITHITTLTNMLLKKLNIKSEKYKFTKEEIDAITHASALHDIGKVAIPDEIINKPGKLTDEEFEIMKTHSAIGGDMLRNMPLFDKEPFMQTAYDICRHHHERYDGKGYPDGLCGDEIPISAQVVSLVDVYDALTSKRCYKEAFSHQKALQMIKDGCCGEFNPVLVESFMEIEKRVEKVMKEF